MKLSVLICSLVKRKFSLQRLMLILQPQLHYFSNDVEILTDVDNGEKIVGTKRNDLIQRATGEYVCFIDDDDLVSKDYMAKIIAAISSLPDCCGIEGQMRTNGRNPRMFIHSIKYNTWYEKDGVYYRTPNHLNPIKRELAVQIPFPAKNIGEDRSYSDRIFPLLKTEQYITGVIYHYNFMSRKPQPFSMGRVLSRRDTATRRTIPDRNNRRGQFRG